MDHPDNRASAAGRKKAATCVPCHGINGVAKIPDAANIAGDSKTYLKNALKAYRQGKRQKEQMSLSPSVSATPRSMILLPGIPR
jgi:cytochrome c553